jgi:hypothetical protein
MVPADLICEIQEQSEAMQVAQREAAASDPKVATGLDAAHDSASRRSPRSSASYRRINYGPRWGRMESDPIATSVLGGVEHSVPIRGTNER